ncbi:NUDIX domain-containing protein [Fontibacillus panacisegetis]|nr:NUDIX domain-containing protein [Fontibacillus panacisegetis]
MGTITGLGTKVGTEPIIMAGSCVLVFNSLGHLLLQRQNENLDWSLIEGVMEPGESLEETAARGLFKETGLRAKTYQLVTVLSGNATNDEYPHEDVYNVRAIFVAKEVEGELHNHVDQGIECKFFCLETALPNLNPSTEYVLKKTGYL